MRILSVGMIVIAGALYQICSKSIPADANPFSSLIAVYATSLSVALILFFATSHIIANDGLANELHKLNYAPFVLGAVITIYEMGFILAYRAGFKASELSAITTVILLVAMLFVGMLIFKEHVTLKTVVGLMIAIVGVIVTKL